MNVIVVGLGSMGKRRIRLIRQIDPGIKIIGVDSRVDRRQEAKEKLSLSVANSIDEGIQDFDAANTCVVISTSPLPHATVINEC